MSPERWREVKSILDAALERSPLEREAFVAEQCRGDVQLRTEVASLLSAHGEVESGDFLDDVSPHLAEAVRPPEESSDEITAPLDTDAEPGNRIGPWRLVREIGRGGMGVVFLAERDDSEFQKRVAIKLIRHGMESQHAIRRFRNERQILARLEHPNIARLIDGGTTGRSLPYYVMEYVEGQPLLRYVENCALPTSERLATFLNVCAAVQYAHRRMIIHRDIKPGNVLVKKDGTPKLLDFGIAKLLDPDTDGTEEVTMAGFRMVTPAYASPEQMRAEPATVRSDVYSLGVVLCELVAGCKPSALPTEERAGALAVPPLTPSQALPPDLRRIILRAVRYAPDERYQSVEELVADLQRFLSGIPIPVSETAPGVSAPETPVSGSVAVLPFRLIDKDTESSYLATGITDAIITKLSNIGRISVRPTSAVLRYADAQNAVAAGRELNVEFVVEGSVHRAGSRVRVTVQLVPQQSGSPIWAASFQDSADDLLELEDSISGQIAEALIPHLTGEEREQLAKRGTFNAKAHEAYLRGRWQWNAYTEGGLANALLYFNQAVAEDPGYARAHAGIADYYIQLGIWCVLPPAESFAAAKQSAARALELDSSLAEAHASYGFALWALDQDYTEAAHHLQLAITLNPDYAVAHQWFGLLMSARGRSEIAIAALERARGLDPRSPVLAESLARVYCNARRFKRAIQDLKNRSRLPDEHSVVQEALAWAYLGDARFPSALTAAREAIELGGRSPLSLAVLAHAEVANGNHRAAELVLNEVELLARQKYVSPYILASVRLAAGNRQGALDALKKARADRDWWATWITVDPRWDPVRDTKAFRLLETPSDQVLAAVPATPSRTWVSALAVLLLSIVGVALLYFFIGRFGAHAVPFESIRMTKVTTNGTAIRAAVSPDGKLVAYTAIENGRVVLFLRTLDQAVPTRLTGPLNGEVVGLQFTGNGRYVSFGVVARNEPTHGILYRVPVTGGEPEALMKDVPGPSSLSADGSRLAFLRPNMEANIDALYVSKPDGSDERPVTERRYPDRFTYSSYPAWSADGRRVAIAIEGTDPHGFYINLLIANADGGSSRIITKPRFQYVERIAWMRDASGLVVIGQEQDSSFQQVWFIPLPKGEPKRISSDLNDYAGVSVTDDGKVLLSVQTQTLSNVYVSARHMATDCVQVTPGSGRYFDLAWTAEGKIVYASDASGQADIWKMDADGANQRLLISGAGRNYSPAASPDGKLIVFHSNRTGNWNIWRMNPDGGQQMELTFGTRDNNWPQFTPDSRFVVYHHSAPNGMWNLFRVLAAGGAPEQITTSLTMHPAISPKDGRIACWYSKNSERPSWQVALLGPEGGDPLQILDVPGTVVPDTALRWTPAGDAISYVDTRGGASNVWLHPIDGSPRKPLTTYTSGQIYSFDWSRDDRLAYSKGISTSDVVLIRDLGSR